jgi:hypothetical protein
MARDKEYGPGARAMAKNDRDETGDVGSGQRKIIPPKKDNGHGQAKVEKDNTSDTTKPPTDKK